MSLLSSFASNESGATAIEYGLIAAGISVAIVVVVQTLGTANAFGLYDMHGNVWQWLEDCYRQKIHGAPADGGVWKEACEDETSRRAARGGSWSSPPAYLRSSFRLGGNPVFRVDYRGFRVARVLSAETLLPP
jgi:formylglycine-generating enzyme required for sulfatase activity